MKSLRPSSGKLCQGPPRLCAGGHELFFKLFPAPGAAADIGCGTGIFAKPLPERGLRVFGVAPNGEMREKAVKALSGFPDFIPVAAPAEATILPDSSVSAVTMGSALHWSDPDAFGKECRRILTPGGLFFSVINARDYEDPFTKAQRALCGVSVPDFLPAARAFAGRSAGKKRRLRRCGGKGGTPPTRLPAK